MVRTSPGGYWTSDARYLTGVIYWRQGNAEAAITQWQSIVKDESDSDAPIYSQILTAIADRSNFLLMKVRVDRALSVEQSRWRSFSYDRLQKFGYRFDTF